ncbi:MAG: hypothetical protein IPP47_00615, partial [Bryobacterales bacterium]|nr:hypothetical protein [Bryobacterales bacterium]
GGCLFPRRRRDHPSPRHALTKGLGYNIGGGFHHAFAGYGEGFCAIHDVAVAIRTLQQEA